MAKSLITAKEYFQGISENKRSILSKAITLVESEKSSHTKLASEIVEKCYPYSGKSLRIGITGPPGAGKSTFIEALGTCLISIGKKIAVLAIDPTSSKSKGSILGDKTRMEKLACSENAFIRPSPSSGELGGTGTATREAIVLCEAAGYEIILVETVGVGQSETVVHSMVDMFLLLTIPGAGDELQGIKRGIMEMADLILINKADSIKPPSHVEILRSQLSNAMHLFPASASGWNPNVLSCSSLSGLGIENVWKEISDFFAFVKTNGFFKKNRKQQLISWFRETLERELIHKFYRKPGIISLLKKQEKKIDSGKLHPALAAELVFKKISGF